MYTIQGDSALTETKVTPQTTAYFRGILIQPSNAGGYEENSNPTGTTMKNETQSCIGSLGYARAEVEVTVRGSTHALETSPTKKYLGTIATQRRGLPSSAHLATAIDKQNRPAEN